MIKDGKRNQEYWVITYLQYSWNSILLFESELRLALNVYCNSRVTTKIFEIYNWFGETEREGGTEEGERAKEREGEKELNYIKCLIKAKEGKKKKRKKE